jgi:hypothetical protein
MLSYQDALDQFNEGIRPLIPADDIVALREAWNDFTDSLTRERNGLNDTQYHFCPSIDDDMPDDDLEFILDAMGVTYTCKAIDARPDGLMDDMPPGSSHYKTTVKRGNKKITAYYSQGPAINDAPDLLDVLQCHFMDATDESVEDWAAGLGYDTDSRKAYKVYKACVKVREKLEQMFTNQELEDLNEMFGDR